jgi:hypothetical protein
MQRPRVRAPAVRASAWLLGAVLLFAAAAGAATAPSYAGRPLAEVLLELRERGLRIVFASNVVRADMTVGAEPTAEDAAALLEQLLAPHRLLARSGPNGAIVVVPRPPAASPSAEAEPAVLPTVFEEELVVTPSVFTLLESGPTAKLGLGREEILALPHLGDDFFRALSLLPGTAANDVSAQFHVRGGRRDETQVRLDGQELFDVFHLKDYDGAASVIAPATLAGADLLSGGFSAEYGDRMSGVLDLRTLSPAGRARYRAGLGILGGNVGGGGSFRDGDGTWIAEARRGSLDLVRRLIDAEDPRYWDAFAKVGSSLGGRHTLTVSALHADDVLELAETEGPETKRFDTDYSSSHVWFNLQTLLGSSLFVETAGAAAAIDRDRRGKELEDEGRIDVRDLRDSDVRELRQGWDWQSSAVQVLEGGWLWREIRTAYDYASERDLQSPLARLRHDGPAGTVRFLDGLSEEHQGLWLADRIRPVPSLTVELGLRWDRYGELDESHASPRVHLAWTRPGGRGVLRASWGRFDQSQRPYELQVEDGETRLSTVERSTQQVLSYETLLGSPGPPGSSREVVARLELYRRRLDDPRPRYEDLFEPVNVFPEVEEGRVAVLAGRSRAHGAELFLRGDRGRRLRWWLAYAWSETEDEIDDRWAPRSFDQRHALNVDLDLALGPRWRLNLAWRYHTGWPTTALGSEAIVDEDGEVEFVPVLGPFHAERLPDYHRLDLRASRRWRWRATEVDVFLDVQNAYDRSNLAGFDMEIDDETGEIRAQPESWPGVLFSAGDSLVF